MPEYIDSEELTVTYLNSLMQPYIDKNNVLGWFSDTSWNKAIWKTERLDLPFENHFSDDGGLDAYRFWSI